MKSKKLTVVLFLLLFHAFPSIANEKVFLMVEIGDIESVRRIITEIKDVNIKKENEETLLHVAARQGFKEIVELLVNSSADINAKNKDGLTPLHYALLLPAKSNKAFHADLHQSKVQTIEFLISTGADVNAQDNDGMTPLMYFSLLFNEIKESFDPISQILEIFIKSNANLNLNDTKGNAVLHNLAFGGDENAVLMLINAGAEVNAKNVNGANALWCASFDGNLNKILVLLEHGAEVNLYSGGITPLHAATGWGVLLMNKERDDESFQEIKKKIEFSEESSLQMTKALVEAGADVYAHGYPADTDLTVLKWYEKLTLGRTPFEYAQAAGNKNVANYLKSVMKEQGKRWYWPF